jgi:hypothetical protein
MNPNGSQHGDEGSRTRGWRRADGVRSKAQAPGLIWLAIWLTGAAIACIDPAPARGQEPAESEVTPSETELYRTWYNEADPAKKLEHGRAYLREYPKGQYADYLGKWVHSEELKQKWAAAEQKYVAALKQEDDRSLFQAGAELLEVDTENIGILYTLANRARLLAHKNPPDYTYAAVATKYAKKAISLIDAGQVPKSITDRSAWESQGKAITLGNLYELLGLIALKDNQDAGAMAAFEKVATYQKHDPMPHYYLGKLENDAYQKLVAQLPAEPEQRAKPEHAALVDQANAALDRVIEHWVQVIAYSKDDSAYSSVVQKPLETYYKARHENDASGLEKLIASYRSGGG